MGVGLGVGIPALVGLAAAFRFWRRTGRPGIGDAAFIEGERVGTPFREEN
jgi:hypothetical protein